MKLKDKVSIITGGSMGVGKGIASGLAAEGSSLVLAARNRPELEKTSQEINRQYNVKVEIFPGDVSKPEDVKTMVAFAIKKFGTVDVLVNCAGIYGPIGLTVDIDEKEWMEAIRINLFGTFLCIKAVLPIMINNKKGKIINLSGGGAASPFPHFSAYGSSKAAVVRLTETIAKEVEKYNIDINAIAPGGINTRLLDQALAAGENAGVDFQAKCLRQTKEGGVPLEKVAALATLLASGESDGLSGRLISVPWDNWKEATEHIKEIMSSDIYTIRRIIPKERGYDW